jgi:hypothetical protein
MSGNARAREGFVEDRPPPMPPKAAAEEPHPEKKHATPPPSIEPSPAEQPPLASEEWPIKVRLLYKAIRTNSGDKVTEVTLREPKAGDINRYGNPVRVNQEGDVVIDERKMTFMIAALTEILPPFIEEMDTRDWNSCAYRLRRFFLPDPAAW